LEVINVQLKRLLKQLFGIKSEKTKDIINDSNSGLDDYNFSLIPKHLKSHRDVTGIAWSFNSRRSDYFEMTNLLFGNAPSKAL
jgi:hypothetical protein